MATHELSNIDPALLDRVCGGGIFSVIRKGWNVTRGIREKIVDTAKSAGKEFGALSLKDKVMVASAASGGIAAPAAAAAEWYSATHK